MEVELIEKGKISAIEQELKIIRKALSNFTGILPPQQKEGGLDFALKLLQDKAGINSKKTIYKWTHEGRIPHVKRGKGLWFFEDGPLGLIPWIENGMPHFNEMKAANKLAENI